MAPVPKPAAASHFYFQLEMVMKDTKPEGKRACRLNAYRHEFTGQMCVFTPDEQKAYDKPSKITIEAVAPVGDYERDLAQTSFPLFDQSIADDRWRLKRARSIESSLFALGMQLGVDDTGAPQVDSPDPDHLRAAHPAFHRQEHRVSGDRPSPAQRGGQGRHARRQALVSIGPGRRQ